MNVKVIGSGSSGNCIIVSIGEHNIMLDCGISLKKLKEAKVRFSDISACLVTHAHADHAKYVHKIIEKAVPVYMTMETCQKIGLPEKHHNIYIIQADLTPMLVAKKIVVMAFPLVHDVDGHVGFVVKAPEIQKNLVYITDTGVLPFMFKGVTHLIVECNYTDNAILNAVEEGETNKALAKRITENHLGLHQVRDYLKVFAPDNPKLEEVHLVHISNTNASNKEIEKKIKEAFPELNIIIH